MTRAVLWLALGASLLLNLAFLSGVVMGWSQHWSGAPGGAKGGARADIVEQLQLTDAQQADLQTLRQGFGSVREAMRAGRKTMRQAVIAALQAPDFDRAAVMTAMAEASEERRAFFADMAEALHGYLKGLEAEQRATFFTLAEERSFLRRLFFGERRTRD